jgi:hypothetical protein
MTVLFLAALVGFLATLAYGAVALAAIHGVFERLVRNKAQQVRGGRR